MTQLNPTALEASIAPRSIADLKQILKESSGPISIGGARYSMGGQGFTEGALHIDMRGMNKIISVDKKSMTATVEAGLTWRQLLDELDKQGLSPKIMQTYSNFTIGGTLSVNAHGRYVGQGPVILSVKSIKVVLADGSVVEASRERYSDIFFAAIGGYGGIGIIAEAVLELTHNTRIARGTAQMAAADYAAYFTKLVRDDAKAVFHNADLYPPDFDKVNAVTWKQTDDAATEPLRLVPRDRIYWKELLSLLAISEVPGGKEWRRTWLDPRLYGEKRVEWRNFEASYDTAELEPLTRYFSTYALAEFFIPATKFDEFLPKLREILQRNDVNVVNISIRHALPDAHTLLSWAPVETFCFVIYYKQGKTQKDKDATGAWIREMTDATVASEGRYYLTYQPHATLQQFLKAFPRAPEFFKLKEKLDPQYRFRSKLWDKYYYRSEDEKQARIEADAFEGYRRPQERSVMSLPEWHGIFTADEYAQLIRKSAPSDFPYLTATLQYWEGYHRAIRETWDAYPRDWKTIGTSSLAAFDFTLATLAKGLYENTLGGIFEWAAGRKALKKDMVLENFQQQVAEDYAGFAHFRPARDYPFPDKIKAFWNLDEDPKSSLARAMERRLSFTTELAASALRAKVQSYGEKPPETTGAIIIQKGKYAFTLLPARQGFTEKAQELLKDGAKFIEIAGNKSIMASFLAPKKWKDDGSQVILYDAPLLTAPQLRRVYVIVQVDKLHTIIPALDEQGVTLEHLFDY
ncbi:MAG: FAD-dependent oxidoreductase [Alphaproteobacteria bacterium]